MKCLKCGAEIASASEFCGDCLQSMDKYPVKPGTVIQLHRREVVEAQKKNSRAKRTIDAEDQVIFLKKALRVMMLLLTIAVTALGICVGLLLML